MTLSARKARDLTTKAMLENPIVAALLKDILAKIEAAATDGGTSLLWPVGADLDGVAPGEIQSVHIDTVLIILGRPPYDFAVESVQTDAAPGGFGGILRW